LIFILAFIHVLFNFIDHSYNNCLEVSSTSLMLLFVTVKLSFGRVMLPCFHIFSVSVLGFVCWKPSHWKF
jgi:hypothetical protein